MGAGVRELEITARRLVSDLLFPDWRTSHAATIETACTDVDNEAWLALLDDRAVGFVVLGFVDEDAARAGEVHVVAVDPAYKRLSIGEALMNHALSEIKTRGIDLAVVATGGDPGHEPARKLYEKLGFRPLPLVRYYRPL
ncbi:MAG: GNAT family N-acetyltransferase [Actinomycetota bacterium]|nr:GNAT family N-acetyltransferase [Actinomycetota bacterium]